MSFAERLKKRRTEKKMSKYSLAQRSGVPHTNIGSFELGTRGIPTQKTVFDLAIGLNLDMKDRRAFMEEALGEKLLDELRSFSIYWFMAMIPDEHVEAVTKQIQEQILDETDLVETLEEHGIKAHSPSLYDIMTQIAEEPKLGHLKARLAQMLVDAVSVDLGYGTVNLRPGRLMDDLLQRLQSAGFPALDRATASQGGQEVRH